MLAKKQTAGLAAGQLHPWVLHYQLGGPLQETDGFRPITNVSKHTAPQRSQFYPYDTTPSRLRQLDCRSTSDVFTTVIVS
jgi:hypothetical protein